MAKNTTVIRLNVYDLVETAITYKAHGSSHCVAFPQLLTRVDCARAIAQIGVGAFHSGTEINGEEWAFGRHSGETTGVWRCRPRQAAQFTYRTTIEVRQPAASLFASFNFRTF